MVTMNLNGVVNAVIRDVHIAMPNSDVYVEQSMHTDVPNVYNTFIRIKEENIAG
jgi:hypothetical protein